MAKAKQEAELAELRGGLVVGGGGVAADARDQPDHLARDESDAGRAGLQQLV